MQLSRHVSLCITMLDRGHNSIQGNGVDDINDYDNNNIKGYDNDNNNSNGSYKNSNYNNNDDYDSNVSSNNDNNCSHDNDIDNDSNDARDFDWVGQTTAANIFWYFDKVIIRSLLADPASCFFQASAKQQLAWKQVNPFPSPSTEAT